jgi:hypothetical protein
MVRNITGPELVERYVTSSSWAGSGRQRPVLQDEHDDAAEHRLQPHEPVPAKWSTATRAATVAIRAQNRFPVARDDSPTSCPSTSSAIGSHR